MLPMFAALALISLTFIGGYRLIRRLSAGGGENTAIAAEVSGEGDEEDEGEDPEEPGQESDEREDAEEGEVEQGDAEEDQEEGRSRRPRRARDPDSAGGDSVSPGRGPPDVDSAR